MRKPEDNVDAVEETTAEMLGRVAKNPISAAPIIMKAFSFKKQSKADQFEFQDENYMSRGSPELTPEDAHVWVTAPFLAFDSFDMWHGAAKWDGDAKGDLCNAAQDVMRARQEASKGRVSMELRFRARCKPAAPGGREGVPLLAAHVGVQGGSVHTGYRAPEWGEYDLQKGIVKK